MGIAYNPAIVTDGLSLYLDSGNRGSYPGTGNTWFDISGNGRNFTGNASFIDNINGARSGAAWACPAASVDNLLNNDFFSLFFYIRFNTTSTNTTSTTGGFNKIFEHTGSSGDRSPGIWRYPSNRRIHWPYNPGSSGVDFGPTGAGTDFQTDTWVSVGQIKNGTSIIAYVNGNAVASTTSAPNPKQTGNSNITLFPGYPADICSLNMVTVYSRPLTPTEIAQNFQATRGRYGI